MVTKEKFIEGVIRYVENEVMPPLPTFAKWGMGAFLFLAKDRADAVLTELVSNDMTKTLGVVNCDGLIDSDRLCKALSESANRYGDITISYPTIGTMSFSAQDISKLSQYINGGAK